MPTVFDVNVTMANGKANAFTFPTLRAASRFYESCLPEIGFINITSREDDISPPGRTHMPTVYDVTIKKGKRSNISTFPTLRAASRFATNPLNAWNRPEVGDISITSRDVGLSLDESIAHWRAQGFDLEHASILALAKHAADAHVRLVCIECVLRRGWAFREGLV